jgi:hypothetical protein
VGEPPTSRSYQFTSRVPLITTDLLSFHYPTPDEWPFDCVATSATDRPRERHIVVTTPERDRQTRIALGPRSVLRRAIASSHANHRRQFEQRSTSANTTLLRAPTSHPCRVRRALRPLAVLSAMAGERDRHGGRRCRSRDRPGPGRVDGRAQAGDAGHDRFASSPARRARSGAGRTGSRRTGPCLTGADGANSDRTAAGRPIATPTRCAPTRRCATPPPDAQGSHPGVASSRSRPSSTLG